MREKHLLSTQSDKMGLWDAFSSIPKTFENLGEGITEVPKYLGRATSFLQDPKGTIEGKYEPDAEEPDEEEEEEDAQRQQQIAAGISEPGYADPGMAPEDGEAFDAEAWREAQIQRAKDFVAINTKAMDTRDRILLRPIQTRDTLRYGGTSSVPDALPLQLVHSANVV